ncbi:MAG: PASTA domain-containing protein [Actinomycetota bacterium]|jgi:beta-lactam-binding protein with PASTA domain|nr:PASTA domain-containing protein [Actinomycetota bacterium]
MEPDVDDLGQESMGDQRQTRRAVFIVLILFLILFWWLLTQFGRVPDVVGMSKADASSAIESAGFDVGVISEIELAEFSGTIAEQSVKPGRWMLKGNEIDLVYALGDGEGNSVSEKPQVNPSVSTTQAVSDTDDDTRDSEPSSTSEYVPQTKDYGPQVPAVQGLSQASAVAVLKAAGYGVEISYRTSNTSVPSGDVFYQDPPPDAYRAMSTVVEIHVSTGAPGGYTP